MQASLLEGSATASTPERAGHADHAFLGSETAALSGRASSGLDSLMAQQGGGAGGPPLFPSACDEAIYRELGVAVPTLFKYASVAAAGLVRPFMPPAVVKVRDPANAAKAKENRPGTGLHDPSRSAQHSAFLSALVEHAESFRDFHRAAHDIAKKLAKSARSRVLEQTRDTEKDAEREERARLQALRNNDMAAYAALLQQAKNERLQYLLQQTDSYLQSLVDLVDTQKRLNAAQNIEQGARALAARAEAAERAKAQAAREAAWREKRAAKAAAKAEKAANRATARAARKAAKAAAKAAAKEQRKAAKAAKAAKEKAAAAGGAEGATGEGTPAAAGAAEAADGAAAGTETAGVGAEQAGAAEAGQAVQKAMEDDVEEEEEEEEEEEDDEEEEDEEEEEEDEGHMVDDEEGAGEEDEEEIVGGAAGPDAETFEEDDDEPEIPADAGDIMARYYRAAHRNRERISTQPKLLIAGDLKPYQMAGLEWMVSLYNNSLNGILADEMGLGKTVQTIALLAYLVERKGNKGPFMVTVPLSTLSNWANEFARWAPALKVVQYKGTPNVRRDIAKNQLVSGRFNVLLTTYDFVMRDKAALRKTHWQYIIIDEGHRLKNSHGKFTRVLGQEYTSRNRLLLTGTPLQNSLPELWSLLNFLLPTVFHSADNFEQWFSKPFASFRSGRGGSGEGDTGDAGEGGGLTKEETMLVINRLHQVLRPFLLRRVKSQVLTQLPEKTEHVVRCELSAWQRLIYRQIQRYGCVPTEPGAGPSSSGGTGAKSLNAIVVQLRKAVNHPFLFQNSYDRESEMLWRAAGKFELLDRMLPKLKATGHRVLIFSQMTSVMDILDDYFAYKGWDTLRLDGSTTAQDREDRMKAFNAPDSPYFIFSLSTRAGGLGINLVTADTVIIFDSDWNPTADAQAQDRAHRIGQTREVRVFRLCTVTPIEERILSRAGEKAATSALLIDGGQFHDAAGMEKKSEAEVAAERRKFLEELLKQELDGGSGGKRKGGGSGEDGDEEGEGEEESLVPGDEDLNEMLARDEVEYATLQRMDQERAAKEVPRYLPGKVYVPPPPPPPSTEEAGSSSSGMESAIPGDLDADAIPRYTRLVTEEEIPEWAHFTPAAEAAMRRKERSNTGLYMADDGEAAPEAEEEDEVEEGGEGGEASGDGTAKKKRRKRRSLIERQGLGLSYVDPSAAVSNEGGMGRRAAKSRSSVSMYIESITEEQYLDIVEATDGDPVAFEAALRQQAEENARKFEEKRAAAAAGGGRGRGRGRGGATRGRGGGRGGGQAGSRRKRVDSSDEEDDDEDDEEDESSDAVSEVEIKPSAVTTGKRDRPSAAAAAAEDVFASDGEEDKEEKEKPPPAKRLRLTLGGARKAGAAASPERGEA